LGDGTHGVQGVEILEPFHGNHHRWRKRTMAEAMGTGIIETDDAALLGAMVPSGRQ
jgi:hypothetical protein